MVMQLCIFEKKVIEGIVVHQLLLPLRGKALLHRDLLSDAGVCNEAVIHFRAHHMYDFRGGTLYFHHDGDTFQEWTPIPPICINHPDF